MNSNRIRRLCLTALVCLLAVLSFAGCGAGKPRVKDFAGYYTFLWESTSFYDRHRELHIALQVFPDGTAVYMHEADGSHRGTLEIEDGEAHVYLTKMYKDGGEAASTYAQYCPLIITLTGDGKTALISSDNQAWYSSSFDLVSEDAFEEFISTGEYNRDIATYDGKNWLTLADRNPELAAQLEAERLARAQAAQQVAPEAEEAEEAPEVEMAPEAESETSTAQDENARRQAAADIETNLYNLLELLHTNQEDAYEEYFSDYQYWAERGDKACIVITQHIDEILDAGFDFDNGRYKGDLDALVDAYLELD